MVPLRPLGRRSKTPGMLRLCVCLGPSNPHTLSLEEALYAFLLTPLWPGLVSQLSGAALL